MLDDNPFLPRAILCTIHRKQKATHICTDLLCQQNPIICSYCLNDIRIRTQHPHESAIKPLGEGIEWLTSIIRNQSKSIQLLYERTIGNRQFEQIKCNLEKGSLLVEELDNRLDNLKLQLEMEMEMLVKQFQRQIQMEKIEFTRRLEDYKRIFISNLENVKKECIELITYQNSLKYYNINNFTLKVINQTERRSQEWLLQQKRVLLKVSQTLESPSLGNNVTLMLSRINKSNLLMIPSWKGEKRDNEVQREIHSCIKTAINNWIQLPDPVDLDQLKLNEYSNSNKFIPYTVAV